MDIDISLLYSTTPGLIALAVVIIAVIFLIAFAVKCEIGEDYLFLALIAIVLAAGVALVGAVIGLWDLPIDYFNRLPPGGPV